MGGQILTLPVNEGLNRFALRNFPFNLEYQIKQGDLISNLTFLNFKLMTIFHLKTKFIGDENKPLI